MVITSTINFVTGLKSAITGLTCTGSPNSHRPFNNKAIKPGNAAKRQVNKRVPVPGWGSQSSFKHCVRIRFDPLSSDICTSLSKTIDFIGENRTAVIKTHQLLTGFCTNEKTDVDPVNKPVGCQGHHREGSELVTTGTVFYTV